MSNPGVAFDTALISDKPNASLAGVPFRVDPNSVSLPYSMKMSQTQTVGGMVVQIYGVVWGDLVVSGQFGAGGWQQQAAFFQNIQGVVKGTIADQFLQVTPPAVMTQPSGSVRFLFPLLNYDFMVFLKSYDSIEGGAVELDNTNINPTWQLTFTIDNDNNNLTQVAVNQYIAGIANGLGYQPNQYNSPSSQGLQQFLQQYGSNPSISSFFQDLGTSTSSTSSAATPSGVPSTLSGNSNAQQVFNYFTGKGLSAIAAAAIVGNFMQESSCNPARAQPNGPGMGLAQWSVNGRWQGVVALAKQNNLPPTNMGVQLAYVWQELNSDYTSALSALRSDTTIAQATTDFSNLYEIPGSPDLPNRISYAQQAYNQYGQGVA